jgi:hypothetical protein
MESVLSVNLRYECSDENKLIALLHEQLISDVVKSLRCFVPFPSEGPAGFRIMQPRSELQILAS